MRDQFKEVGPTHIDLVLIEVKMEHRGTRGRFWRDNADGYTNKVEFAGLFPADYPLTEASLAYKIDAWTALNAAKFDADQVVKRIKSCLARVERAAMDEQLRKDLL